MALRAPGSSSSSSSSKGGGGGGASAASAAEGGDVRSASLAWSWEPRAASAPAERGARSAWEARRALVSDLAGPALVEEAAGVAAAAGGNSTATSRPLLFVALSAPSGYGGSQGWVAALDASARRAARVDPASAASVERWQSARVPCALAQVDAHASWGLLLKQQQQQTASGLQINLSAKRGRALAGDEDDWSAGPAAEAGGGDRERRGSIDPSSSADVVLARCAPAAGVKGRAIYAFDAATGDLLWRRGGEQDEGEGDQREGGGSSSSGGRAPLAASYRGALLLPTQPPAPAPPANFGATPRVLAAVDLRSGQELWHFGLPLPPPVVAASSADNADNAPLHLPQQQHECTAPTVYFDGDVPAGADAAAALKLGPGAGGTVLVGCACAAKGRRGGGGGWGQQQQRRRALEVGSAATERHACAHALDLATGKQRWARVLSLSAAEPGDAGAWPEGALAWGHAPLVLRPAAAAAQGEPAPAPAPRAAIFVAARTVHAVATLDGAPLWNVPLAEGDTSAAWMQPAALYAAAGAGGRGGGVGDRAAAPSAATPPLLPSPALVLMAADASSASQPVRPRTSVYAFDAASGARLWARVFEGWPQPRARPGDARPADAGVAAPLKVVLRQPPPPPPQGSAKAEVTEAEAPSPPPSPPSPSLPPVPIVLLELCRTPQPKGKRAGGGSKGDSSSSSGIEDPPFAAAPDALSSSSSSSPTTALPKCCLRGLDALHAGDVRWGFCVPAAAGAAATRPAAERAIWALWSVGAALLAGMALSAVYVGLRGAAEDEAAVGDGHDDGGGLAGAAEGVDGGTAGAAATAMGGGDEPSSGQASSWHAPRSRPASSRAPSRVSTDGGRFADGPFGEHLLDSEEVEEEDEEEEDRREAKARGRAGGRT
jgi:outer membrane protein assembly factor BamB